jgi:hypothetical protein
MRSRLLVATLALVGSLLLPGPAAAQVLSARAAAASLRLRAPRPATLAGSHPADSRFILPDSVVPKRKDHTVTGLLIGAGVGFVSGWVFYDAICEAVDNRCSDSRVRLLVLGTSSGAALGALIGSLAD